MTSQASPPPSRDQQHHFNQHNPSTTAKENELRLVAEFEGKIAADRAHDKKYAHKNRNQNDKMTLDEEMQQYDDEMFAAEDAAEDAEILTTDEFLRLYGSEIFTICDIDEEHNTDNKVNATTTTTEEEKEDVSTTSEEKLGTPTTTGIEEKEVRNMNDDAIIEDKFTTSTTTDIPNIIENTTTVYITNTVHTTDTTDTNKVIETPILSPSPTSNNYYDNIDNKILRTEYEGTIVFEQLLGTNHCLHGYSQQYYYRRLIN